MYFQKGEGTVKAPRNPSVIHLGEGGCGVIMHDLNTPAKPDVFKKMERKLTS